MLIVSRPESHIVSTFLAVDVAHHVHHLCLDEWKSIDDIEIYLRAELEVVKKTHPFKLYLDEEWPSADPFKKLLHKSFESFAYAFSAICYISSHDRHPEALLNNLLGLTPNRAYEAHAELDMLYRHILESLDKATCFTIRKILCLHAYLPNYNNLEYIPAILGEKNFMAELAMTKVSSVICVKDYYPIFRRPYPQISYYHTSFSDFLCGTERSGILYLYSPDIASAVTHSLSTFWIHPIPLKGYDFLWEISNQFSINISAGDMHMHILRSFLATTKIMPHLRFDSFFRSIDLAVNY